MAQFLPAPAAAETFSVMNREPLAVVDVAVVRLTAGWRPVGVP